MIKQEVFDFRQLQNALQDYAKPRDKISLLLASGDVVRVKKGLYVFGRPYRKRPVSCTLLANLIYGPSYISLEYALSYHGLIPERVETVTSVTPSKQRTFETPFGTFSYRKLALSKYDTGFTLEPLAGGLNILIAKPEKALIDTIWNDKRPPPTKISEFRDYLLDDLRLDPSLLKTLDRPLIRSISAQYHSKKIQLLSRYLDKTVGER